LPGTRDATASLVLDTVVNVKGLFTRQALPVAEAREKCTVVSAEHIRMASTEIF